MFLPILRPVNPLFTVKKKFNTATFGIWSRTVFFSVDKGTHYLVNSVGNMRGYLFIVCFVNVNVYF